jgi:hydrogenase nickel incorporation protein HypB
MMCTICGCSSDTQTHFEPGHEPGHAHDHGHHHHHHHHDHGHTDGIAHDSGKEHGQGHGHKHGVRDDDDPVDAPSGVVQGVDADRPDPAVTTDAQADSLDFGGGLAGVHIPGLSQQRIVRIEQGILGKNDRHAAGNRRRLAQAGSFALNLVSSPGSGKTTLLVKTIEALRARLAVAVIEGDQQTSHDAERIRACGVEAIQVNTGKGCHLDAHMVEHAMAHLDLVHGGVLFIENVGNLVCPAAFDLGEAHKVVILSVTEGEDKPLKYPGMFAASSLMVLSKIDLLPHIEFDLPACLACARRVNPSIQILQLSARSGQGMGAWIDWIVAGAGAAQRSTAQRPARTP